MRTTLDRTMSSGWTIKFGGQLSFRHLSALSKAVSLRLRYAQEKLQCEGGLHLFDARALPLRADAAYMPYSYYIPMLRGAGLRLITKVRLSLSPRTLLHLRYTPDPLLSPSHDTTLTPPRSRPLPSPPLTTKRKVRLISKQTSTSPKAKRLPIPSSFGILPSKQWGLTHFFRTVSRTMNAL
ncbi:hypothetical protein [Porphyromonas cangingivalis]|uniref:hypothetical protein n=1 Tax=Porphyromonas cangingivalis TaxID=36874 RepID=UPI00047170BA|nr:hypothetical protein [Porphyromonas cangingivalis]